MKANTERFFFSAAALLFATVLSTHSAYAEAEPAKAKDAAAPAPAAEGETPALAPGTDYLCEVEVFYRWKPNPAKKTGSKQADELARREALPPGFDPIRDFFTTAGEQGASEEEVKNRLSTKIPQLEVQAMEQCKRTHQDQTLCVTAKMRSAFDQYNKLDFVARRAMAEAVNKDCQHKLGKCLSTEASEIKCHLNRPPEVSPKKEGEEPAAGGKEKEAAKDKKK